VNRRILNIGLGLAMELGEQWLQPIQTRLGAKFPSLSGADLDGYDSVCRQAMRFGHKQVVLTIRRRNHDLRAHFERFRAVVLVEYPWITKKNLGRLFSQGCYYAMK
jgi:hypothetical protein